jgi:hypothetical protein
MEIKRRDSASNPELHEFYIEDGGEEYVFHVVKQGRVAKQQRLAAEKQQAASESDGQSE